MDIRFRRCWPVALLLSALTALAQPTIVRFAVQPPLPIIDGVTYDATAPQVYAEWDLACQNTNANVTDVYSPGICFNTSARVELKFTVSVNHLYAISSCTNLGNITNIFTTNWFKITNSAYNEGWVLNSPWFGRQTNESSMTWTQAIPVNASQRFFRVMERDL